jgi:flagellar biosynthetic protein FlhB
MIFLAVADYVFQKWQFEKDQRMTKQETKEEMKQSEGDPKIKSRIRAIQMEMSRKRMMAAIPGAAVVITNPTHLAVALKYETGEMVAPRVVAKGQGFIALRIREIAAENHVPIVENKPLAQTLYKAVEIGKDIPVELYRAVAEILAFVYRMKGA